MHENIKLKYYIFEYNITLDYSCTFARTAREKKKRVQDGDGERKTDQSGGACTGFIRRPQLFITSVLLSSFHQFYKLYHTFNYFCMLSTKFETSKNFLVSTKTIFFK